MCLLNGFNSWGEYVRAENRAPFVHRNRNAIRERVFAGGLRMRAWARKTGQPLTWCDAITRQVLKEISRVR